MFQAIKIQLYPNATQIELLAQLFGCYRVVYNDCLEYKQKLYAEDKLKKESGENLEKRGSSISVLGKFFHGKLRDEKPYLKDQNTKVMKQSIINLEDAYDNFFKGGAGFPKFKSKHDVQKARFPQEAVSSNTFDEKSSRLNLTTTIRGLLFKCSERDEKYLKENKSSIKSVTISLNKANEYHASILVDGPIQRIAANPKSGAIGIDLGVKSMMVMSNEEEVGNPKWIRSSEKQLKKLHRQLSKKKLGSKNRNKAKKRLAKKHQQIKNQKQDHMHKLTTRIIDENQVVVLEDLNVAGMTKNHKLAKAIQEVSFGEIRRQIEYKAKWHDRTVVLVDRWFPSSKLCSECRWKHPNLTLKDREFQCQDCGCCIDRDLNAAINIEVEGMRILEAYANGDSGYVKEGSVIMKARLKPKRVKKKKMVLCTEIGKRIPESLGDVKETLEDYPTKGNISDGVVVDDKEATPLRSSGRLIQEIGLA